MISKKIKSGFIGWLGDSVAKLRGARFRLARSSGALRDILGKGALTEETRQHGLDYYLQAIDSASRLGSQQITGVVREFEPYFCEAVVGDMPQLRNALAVLESNSATNTGVSEVAIKVCRMIGDKVAMGKHLQNLCLLLAQSGDANGLLARLFDRQKQSILSSKELQAILGVFLEHYSFEASSAWRQFLAGLPEHLLPSMHQVYGAIGRAGEAAELAEKSGDCRSAALYLLAVPGSKAGQRALDLAEKASDSKVTVACHLNLAECLWTENKFTEAEIQFLQAGQLDRVSDCQRRLGNFAEAIRTRSDVPPGWRLEISGEIESAVSASLAAREYVGAAQLLRSVVTAWRSKPNEPGSQPEADRVGHLLAEVVKTGRAALEAEVRATQAQAGAQVFKRWSLLEESAGNFLEAGLQAELAQDYFSASLLFEKAGAFGQALSALGQTAQGGEPKRRAELLERGGDFFMAGLLYERLKETEKAMAMFEAAGEFVRAANLWRAQIGEAEAAFDEKWLDLLTKANRVESLAELCLGQARVPGRPAEMRARLLRRIKQLAESGLLAPKWLDQAAAELKGTEASARAEFDQRVTDWAATAEREVLATYLESFGMDLGTSNSVVALFNQKTRQAEVVEWRGRQTIPSVFAIDQAGVEVVGIPESELFGKSPRAIVTRAKRAMGTDKRFKVDGNLFRAEEISARFINHARKVAHEYLLGRIADRISALASEKPIPGAPPPGEWITAHLEAHPPKLALNHAVITVPAYFNDAQKQATRTAATLANVTVLRLIHEPTAACLAQRMPGTKEETVLVVDLGAGTLDLSLLKVGGDVLEVEEIEGDNLLGSSDLDEILYAHFIEVVKKQTGNESIQQGLAGRRLHQACEELKIELSSRASWTLKLPHLAGTKSAEISLHRAELERLAAPWLKRIQDTCRKVKGRPSRVLLIGGGALMPAVRRCVKDVFGTEPGAGADSLTAVARGAALQSAILAGVLKDHLVLDVVPFSLGIRAADQTTTSKFDPLIRKHSIIPVRASRTYTTKVDNQPNVHIEVFQGEDPKPENNFKIGQFILDGIPNAKAGVPQIEVTFDIDANCLLLVTARDMVTNRERQIRITDSHLLTPAQVTSLQKRLRESQANQENFERLGKLVEGLETLLREASNTDLVAPRRIFEELLLQYQKNMARYSPTSVDNETLLEVYRERTELESKARLALDRWDTLKKSAEVWQAGRARLDLRSEKVEQELKALLDEGDPLLRRVQGGAQTIREIAATYRKWTNVLRGLAIDPAGSAEDLARHFLRLARHDEAMAHYRRLGSPTRRSEIELGLEILARQRKREDYIELLEEHRELLAVTRPDFIRLNQSVGIFSASVVWIQQTQATGSGFAIGPNEVATNRHVITNVSSGKILSPNEVRVVSKHGVYRVTSIHVPAAGRDDVAILRIAGENQLVPLHLGFSELVEVGERILTLGFPSPGTGGFEENLYCNVGLVNRIRPSEYCSERVLEVSIELQGGISGAPILNEFGAVVGLVTFGQIRSQANQVGQLHIERSFYALPVEVLRQLRTEIPEIQN
jgi:molecular chaperone DnaK